MKGVLGYAMLKIAEHGRDLVGSGGITEEQLKDALVHRERELSAKSPVEIATQLLHDLPQSAFANA